MKKIILLSFALIFQLAAAQRRYAPGVVYLRNNDSLIGKIKDQLFFSPKKIKFIGADGKTKKFSPKKAMGYSKLGVLKYLSIPAGIFGGRFRFMQVVEDGDLILLTYITTHSNSGGGSFAGGGYGGGYGGGMHTGGGTTTSINYYIKSKKTGKSDRIPLIGYKDFMLKYVSDDAEIKKLVEEKSLVYRDAQLVVKKYNDNKRKK